MSDPLPSTHHSPLSTGHWPSLTALCPTYGRFERLRDAVACLLLQDYPGEKRLLILNDAPVPIVLGRTLDCVRVANHPARFPTLGHKRQALLEAAGTPLVAHWDDDDLYLPWHLTMCVSALTGRPWPLDVAVESVPSSLCTDHCALPRCAKPRAAWWAVGPRERFEVRGPCHNVFEGQMVFEWQEALRLGGYPPKVSGQAKALLEAFRRAGKLYTWNPADEDISYVYRWGDGCDHVSARKALTTDADFGAGRPLIPCGDPLAWARDRLAGQFRRLADGVQARCSAEQRARRTSTEGQRRHPGAGLRARPHGEWCRPQARATCSGPPATEHLLQIPRGARPLKESPRAGYPTTTSLLLACRQGYICVRWD